MVTPPKKKYAHVLDPLNLTLFSKSVFANIIKDLEMKLPWVTQVGSKFSDNCFYKSEADRDYTHRGKDQEKIRQRLELDSCKSRKTPGPAEAGRGQEESSS